MDTMEIPTRTSVNVVRINADDLAVGDRVFIDGQWRELDAVASWVDAAEVASRYLTADEAAATNTPIPAEHRPGPQGAVFLETRSTVVSARRSLTSDQMCVALLVTGHYIAGRFLAHENSDATVGFGGWAVWPKIALVEVQTPGVQFGGTVTVGATSSIADCG